MQLRKPKIINSDFYRKAVKPQCTRFSSQTGMILYYQLFLYSSIRFNETEQKLRYFKFHLHLHYVAIC